MQRKRLHTCVLLAAVCCMAFAANVYGDSQLEFKPPEISAGGQAALNGTTMQSFDPSQKAAPEEPFPSISLVPGVSFPGFDFDDNPTHNGGFLFIPPDCSGAAGTDRVVAVVNSMIECRSKAGVLLWRTSLSSFFAPAPAPGTLGSSMFDPKVVYDQYAGRFVVCALEVDCGVAPLASRIVVAVSSTGSPAGPGVADWNYDTIDSKITVGVTDYWADYPGLETDEEAIYITVNYFGCAGGGVGSYLWIVHKSGPGGGLYGGGTPVHTGAHDFQTAAGAFGGTHMPAKVFGAGGVAPGVGTFLVMYDGLTYGCAVCPCAGACPAAAAGCEAVQVVRVDDPLGGGGGPFFTVDIPPVGDIEDVGGACGFPALPDCPQLGSPVPIEVNGRRTLDAVWRAGELWVTTTILAKTAPDIGETTAHWFKLDTSGVVSSASPPGLISLLDEGNIGGEDIHPAGDVTTFFPAVAVNSLGEAKFGFSAGSSAIYCGAYAAARKPADPPGTVRPTATVAPGVDYYVRTFCSSSLRNRWGDYSGASVDPSDDRTFWIYNQAAIPRGTPTAGGCVTPGPEDGRWGTFWMECAMACVSVTCPPDLIVGNGFGAGSNFDLEFCVENCGSLPDSICIEVTDTQGWTTGINTALVIPAGGSHCVTLPFAVPGSATAGTMSTVTLKATSKSDTLDMATCTTKITVDETVPVSIQQFEAVSGPDGVLLSWRFGDNWRHDLLGVHVQRAEQLEGPYVEVQGDMSLASEMSFLDRSAQVNREYWYRLVTMAADGPSVAGPIHVETSGVLSTNLFQPQLAQDGQAVQIRYSLGRDADARIEIFDVRGRRVRTLQVGQRHAGTYLSTWNLENDAGSRTARGVYFVNLRADRQVISKKFVLAQ